MYGWLILRSLEIRSNNGLASHFFSYQTSILQKDFYFKSCCINTVLCCHYSTENFTLLNCKGISVSAEENKRGLIPLNYITDSNYFLLNFSHSSEKNSIKVSQHLLAYNLWVRKKSETKWLNIRFLYVIQLVFSSYSIHSYAFGNVLMTSEKKDLFLKRINSFPWKKRVVFKRKRKRKRWATPIYVLTFGRTKKRRSKPI